MEIWFKYDYMDYRFKKIAELSDLFKNALTVLKR